ncbi:LysR family transcriptional regulator [Hydrogenophaga sp.]|uniref:LysR family transcriptional regulator n=1 Tax=Hydrogenophaga sp. TaxID=1904254 RepID=UPI0027270200|nr:LysR family transcriptional regulator [Hydrogenophaga sp.]MDO9435547.1 LysR family transcriptional regulator [Hydrogenophaga sp.]
MDPRHLVQLAVILEKGSITQASRHLHLTQPTLTHNMQTLEMQADGTLFERSRYGVRSTVLGEMLAREGRAILQRLQDAQELTARHRRGIRHQLRLGVGPLIGAALSDTLTHTLLEHFPDLALMLQSDRPHRLVEQLIDGRHDFVIAPSWLEHPPPGLERQLLVHDSLGVFCGSPHPLARRRTLRAGDANGQRWLSLGTASPFDQDVRDMLAGAGIEGMQVEITVLGEALMLLQTLARGRHLAVLPHFPVRMLRPRYPLKELVLPTPVTPRPIYLWYRATHGEDAALTAVRDLLVHEITQLAEPR